MVIAKKDLHIGVFFGSRSPEHDVSIITGQLIIHGLKGLGYGVTPVYIDKRGEWYAGDILGEIEFFQQPDYEERLPARGSFCLKPKVSEGKLVLRKKGWGRKELHMDLAFPAFHGMFGEDGTIQGLFEMMNVPYVGCDVASSVLTMDKVFTKLLYRAHGIPTTNFKFFTSHEWEGDRHRIVTSLHEQLHWPVFVKPSRLGSSIGIAKIKTNEELDFAIEVAFHYDNKIVVEESVENVMDVTCAVLGNDEPQPSLLQETAFQDQFFSYEEKYLKKGGAQLGKAKDNIFIPARLDEVTTKSIQEMSVRIFKLFGCSGIARVDYLYDRATKKCYANEVNTLPGTLYHHLWKKSGIALDELLGELIRLALVKHSAKKNLTLTFSSNILQQARGRNGKLQGR